MIRENLLQTPLEESEFSVLDVETTGLSARTNHIIEIGIVKVKNLKVTDKYQSLINPGCSIPSFITRLTGIDDNDVSGAPFFNDIIHEVEKFIGDSVISAHNLGFDDSFLKFEFIRNGNEPLSNERVCTLKIARRLFPALHSKSLSSITKYLRLKNKNPHRAIGDAEVTARALIKMIKKLKKDEGINSLEKLIEYQSRSVSSKLSVNIPKKFTNDIFSLPNAPGIYYFLNSKGKVIYVGKAKSLRDRVKSYFSSSASSKARRIVKQASRIKTEITNSELTALLAEAEAIKLIKPRHNAQLKKYGNKYFLKINKSTDYPKVEISNHFDFDGNDYFGLYISRKKAEQVLNIIDKTFAVRECTDKEFKKKKRCFLADIERCTAPCEKKVDKLYKAELNQVYDFLCGQNQQALDRLLRKMKEFSLTEKYEKAAEIKETIDLILAQTHKSSLLLEPVNSTNVLFEIKEKLSKDFVLMLSGKIFIKSYLYNKDDAFDEALDDYYENSYNLKIFPADEDLEKMKITLNWLIKNRNKVRVFYLNDYTTKNELYKSMNNNFAAGKMKKSSFNIKELVKEKELI